MRASAAARPTPVPAPVTIAILDVVMRFLRLRVGLRLVGVMGHRHITMPAPTPQGLTTAASSLHPARPASAKLAFVRRTSRVLRRVQRRPARLKKTNDQQRTFIP